MQSSIVVPISANIAFGVLRHFINEIEAIHNKKIKYDKNALIKRYEGSMRLIEQLKTSTPELYQIISILINYNMFRIDKNQKYSEGYSTSVTDLVCTINEADKFPEKYLRWPNYIICILGMAQDDSRRAFQDYEDIKELPVISSIHNAIDKFRQARADQNELVDQSAMILSGSLCYINAFIDVELGYKDKIQKLKKNKKLAHAITILSEYFNRNRFDDLREEVYSKTRIMNSAKLEINHQILLFWFWIYNYNVEFVNEIRFNKKTSLENILDLSFYDFFLKYDFTPIFDLLKSLSDSKKYNEYNLIPDMSPSVNIARALMDQIKFCIMLAEKRICKDLHDLDLEPIIKDFYHPLWEVLYRVMVSYYEIYRFKKKIYDLSFPNQDQNKLPDIEWKRSLLHFNFAGKVIKKMDKIFKEHKEKYNPDELITLEVKKIKARRKNPRPVSIQKILAGDDESSPEESVSEEQVISIDDEIVSLISHEEFPAAIDLANQMKLDALETGDNYSLAKAYNYLGDVWRAVAHCKKIDIQYKENALKISYLKYKSCIATIDDNNYSAEKIQAVKQIRQFLVEQINSKEYSEVKLAVENTQENNHPFPQQPNISIINQEIAMPDYVLDILKRLDLPLQQSYIVGGIPRDHENAQDPHDYDIVTTLSMKKIMELFADKKGQVVGFLHPVYVIKPEKPGQKEIQIGLMKCHGFNSPELVYLENRMLVVVNRTMDIMQDAISRGLTCDSLYYDWKNKIILDPYDAMRDIRNKEIHFVLKNEEYTREMFLHNPFIIFRMLRLSIRDNYKINAKINGYIKHYLPILQKMDAFRVNNEISKTLLESDKINSSLVLFEHYHLFQVIYNLDADSEKLLIKRIRQAFSMQTANKAMLLWCLMLAYKIESHENIHPEHLARLGIHDSHAEFIREVMTNYEMLMKENTGMITDADTDAMKIAGVLLNTRPSPKYQINKSDIKKSPLFFTGKENIMMTDMTNSGLKHGYQQK